MFSLPSLVNELERRTSLVFAVTVVVVVVFVVVVVVVVRCDVA